MRRSVEEPSSSRTTRDDRGVRTDSVTNQLRALAKQKPRKRRTVTLEPLEQGRRTSASSTNHVEQREHVSVQKQIQGPVSLQWLIDDFVQAAGVGDIEKVDHYIRGGIPIDMKHSVLQQTALHASAALQNDVVTRHLVQAGASVDALTKDRESTLHLAARYHSELVAKEVLRNNADMHVLNKCDMLAVDIAAEVQDHSMERLLEPPPNPPSDVRATAISATSLTIAWSSHQRSSHYQFRVSWVLSGSLGEFFEICTSSSFRINNLMPAVPYEVRVQAGNHTIGWSTSSDLLVVETDGDVPNAMAAPIIVRVSDKSITMRIRLPPSNGAEVQRVSIQSQCSGSIAAVSTSSFRKLLRSADQEQRWESVVCEASLMRSCEDNPHEKEHTVGGLLPGHVYYFRVKASNRFGWSPDGEVSDGICTNDEPKVVASTPRTMALVWTKPYSTELIDKYQVQARASYSTRWEIVADNIEEQRAEIKDLIPATTYSFRVVPHYASLRGWEDAEVCAVTELCSTLKSVPEPPVALRVVDRTANSVTLSWETPRCNGHALEAYKVEYRLQRSSDDVEGWVIADAAVPVDTKAFTITGLAEGKPHQFQVCARNAKGEGRFAHLLDPPIWTYAFFPPAAAVCVNKTSFSLTIAWKHGASDDTASQQPGLLYEIQMCHVDSGVVLAPDLRDLIASSGQWRTVITDCAERQAVVSGLNPLGCYCFRVRARAAPSADSQQGSHLSDSSPLDNGSSVFSPISDVFQTLRRM